MQHAAPPTNLISNFMAATYWTWQHWPWKSTQWGKRSRVNVNIELPGCEACCCQNPLSLRACIREFADDLYQEHGAPHDVRYHAATASELENVWPSVDCAGLNS